MADPDIALLPNPGLDRDRPYGEHERAILCMAGGNRALTAIAAWPGYRATPLHALPAMAARLEVGALLIKDESHRFELSSFKALGGAYAVERLAVERGVQGLTVTCATDGNHGRAVAWGASRVGARSVIYVHETVSAGRAAAIAGFAQGAIRSA
jgi:diaminopropionate ammonia-lyase